MTHPNRTAASPRGRSSTAASVDGRGVLLSHVTEKEWLAQVIRWAKRSGFHVYHTHDSRRSDAGFPDLFLVRNGRAIAAELKATDGKVTKAQENWLTWLYDCGIPIYVWKPQDEEEVRRVLGVGA
jgi:acetolactate synthase regulatory subunit